MQHAFDVYIASQFGVNEAILLNNMAFWTQKNLSNNKHIHEGYCWTYNTIKAFCEIFPYWTRHQIEHLIKKCVAKKLIIEGNFNKVGYDRTKWYAIHKEAFILFPSLFTEKNINKMNNASISENSEIDLPNFRNGIPKNPKPIPDSKTQIKNTDVCGKSKSSSLKNFEHTHNKNQSSSFCSCSPSNESDNSDLRSRCLTDKLCLERFETKFADYQVSIEQLFDECYEHYQKKMTVRKFLKWIGWEKIENHTKRYDTSKKSNGDAISKYQEYYTLAVSEPNRKKPILTFEEFMLSLEDKKEQG